MPAPVPPSSTTFVGVACVPEAAFGPFKIVYHL